MVIHEKVYDITGAGKWDINTTRYVPLYGGSRSRLPVADDPEYRRYVGFVGMDEHLTPDIYRLSQLYAHLGGKPIIPPGDEGKFTALILGETLTRIEEAVAADTGEAAGQ
ncbi:MAG TPA: hypothetical protein VKB51_15340 [bacterium]|nr:hypothetical protein [bacterium]